MPPNPGFNPYANKPGVIVDLKLRNGSIHRGQKPTNWRWSPWKAGYESQFDITDYQEAKP